MDITSDLLKKYLQQSTGFDSIINNVKIVNVGNGNCTATMKIEERHLNALGGLHGGCSATIADVISSLALLTIHPAPSVSVQLHLRYLSRAKLGDELLIDARTLKAGKSLAFQTIEIRNKETSEVLVTGEHTKFMLQSTEQHKVNINS